MIAQFSELLSKPGFWVLFALIVIYLAFAAYVDSLDAPTDKDSTAYRHWFRWANKFCMRANRAARAFHIEGDDKPDATN